MAVEQDRCVTQDLDAGEAGSASSIPLPAAVLLHAAVLAICALAVYSARVVGAIDPSETHPAGNPPLAVLIAFAVLVPIVGLRAQLAERTFGKLVLALGLAYTFGLAFEPLMPSGLLGEAAMTYQISWANVALLVMVAAWCGSVSGRWRGALGFTGLEAPALVSAVALCGLGLALLLSVGRYYDADAGYTVMLMLKSVQYGLICIIAMTASGARRVGVWLHVYVLLALTAALILSLLAAEQPLEAQHVLWRAVV